MLASMSVHCNCRVQDLFSVCGLRCLLLLQYSTSAAPIPPRQNHFIVDYLMEEIDFPREEAISTSTKVSSLKSPKNPDLVLNFFKQCGLSKTQMRHLIYSVPTLLSSKVEKTLRPKIRILHDLGLSGWDLVKAISNNPSYFNRGLFTHIIPSVDFLKQILGSDENVMKAIKKSKWLLVFNTSKRLLTNVALLREYGLSDERIKQLILRSPGHITQKRERLESVIQRVEEEYGIPRNSPMFLYGMDALASVSRSTIEKKFEVFRSFGWSDSEIVTMVRILPHCLGLSEAKIRTGLSYFVKELGYTPAYLAARPKLLMYSFEKRVVPRNEVLKVLREKQLHKSKMSLYSAVALPEYKFMKDFVLPYRDKVPDMYQAYINNMEV